MEGSQIKDASLGFRFQPNRLPSTALKMVGSNVETGFLLQKCEASCVPGNDYPKSLYLALSGFQDLVYGQVSSLSVWLSMYVPLFAFFDPVMCMALISEHRIVKQIEE